MRFQNIKDIKNKIHELVENAYVMGYEDGLKDGKESVQIDDSTAYERGLNDAWELARKMYQYNPVNNKQLCEELFDMNFNEFICTISPSEAIAEIKEYEEKQKRNCDTCKYGGHTLQDLKKCVYCDGSYYWTPKQTSKMTLDEAIKHCEEVADSKCDECGAEHRQLAEWLKELKRLRELTRWIPVSERPPETADEVIAYDGADAFFAWYGVNGWHSTDNRFDPRVPIIEWKPINLPKAEEKTNDSCWKEYYESKFMKKV